MAENTVPYAELTQLPTLEAKRIRLRSLNRTDVEALFAVFSDPEVTRYWSSTAMQSLSEAQSLFENIQQMFAERQLFQWGIALAHSDQLIGTCTLHHYAPQHLRSELGFALGSAWQRQGYATEAVTRMIRHTHEDLGIERLEADVDPRNGPSLTLLEKLGFQREGLLRARYRVGGEVQDTVLLGRLQSEHAAI